MGNQHRGVGLPERCWFQRLQAFEDAVAYRRARVDAPCPDCGPAASGGRCDDHGRDLDLIDEYLRTIHLTTECLRVLHREYLQAVCHPPHPQPGSDRGEHARTVGLGLKRPY